MRTSRLVAVLVPATAVAVGAHDFWLAASDWHATPGAAVTVTANVGDRFPVPTSYTDPSRVESLELVGPAGRTRLSPSFRREGNSLAVTVALPAAAGSYLVVMTVTPRFIEIPPTDFAAYLSHEGLERVVAERDRRGESAKPGRERYSRYAKLVVRAGDGPSDHVTRPVGLPAELVPLADPTRLRRGDTLAVRLLAGGEPVADALVGAVDAGSTGAPDDWPVKARTDRDGVARLRLDAPGPWLVRSVHMVRREGESGPQAVDWESFWASLAFDLAR